MAELTREEILDRLRQKAEELGSQKALAFKLGVSEQYLSEVMNWRPIGPTILRAMNIRVEKKYHAS